MCMREDFSEGRDAEAIDLYTLQTAIKSAVDDVFSSPVWVRAEISAVKARPGGHCYMELSQSSDDGVVAKVSAIIWSSRYRFIAPYFESVTGSPIKVGITVLARVSVSYSQLYGLSLIVEDINAEYTVGEKEKERLATIERLGREGLMDLQKELAMPSLPYHLAVVSAPDAAGYRDFVRHLTDNEYGFTFETELYEAVMQGVSAPDSVAGAIARIVDSGNEYDAVLVIRGGGAKLDLACFDDYRIASAIARCPIPVLTAVGHDQDFHICDMVAWRYVKTPTALADFFVEMYMDEDQRISSYGTRLRTAFLGKISLMGSKVDVLEARIMGADPRNILSRGYALILDGEGKVLKRAAGSAPGEHISVMFRDGVLESDVTGVKMTQSE